MDNCNANNQDKQTKKTKLKNTALLGAKEGLIPFLLQCVILVAVILEFAFLIANDVFPDVPGVPARLDEVNDPNVMRLAYLFLTIPATVLLVWWALGIKENRKAFWPALVAGIVAWQGVGECSWHFGLPSGIGEFVFFPKIEGPQGTWVLILFGVLLFFVFKKYEISWAIKVFVLSFFCNWMGHWLLIGIAPIFPIGGAFNPETWVKTAGYVFGLGGMLFILYRMLFRAKTTEERLMLSLLLYTAFGMFVEGVFGVGASLE